MFFFILFHFLARLTTPSAARAARTSSARSAGGRQSRGGQQLGGQSRVSSQSRGPVHSGSQCNCSSSSSSTPSSARTFAAVRAPPPLPKADLSEPCAPPTSGGMVSVPLPSSSPRARSADGDPRERPEGCRPEARVAGRGEGGRCGRSGGSARRPLPNSWGQLAAAVPAARLALTARTRRGVPGPARAPVAPGAVGAARAGRSSAPGVPSSFWRTALTEGPGPGTGYSLGSVGQCSPLVPTTLGRVMPSDGGC